MKDRLHKLMEAEGLNPAKFADEIGVQRSSISHIISGRNKPSYDFIIKILDRFKGINAEWLLTGRGSMIKGLESSEYRANSTYNLFSEANKTQTSESSDAKAVNTKKMQQNTYHSEDTDIPVKKPESRLTLGQVTNVNNAECIVVFYKDGTYKQYNPRE